MGHLNLATSILSLGFLALFQPVLIFSIDGQNEKEFLKRCPPFRCGNLGIISFPFAKSSEEFSCGPFVVDDCDEEVPKMKLSWESNKWFQLHNISEFQYYGDTWNNITVTDTNLQKQIESRDCRSFEKFNNFLPLQFPGSLSYPKNIELVKCNHTLDRDVHSPRYENENKECPNFHIYYNHTLQSPPPTPPNCTAVLLPVNPSMSYESNHSIFELLTATFSFQAFISVECYLCPLKDGQCQQNPTGEWRCLDHMGKEISIFPQQTKHVGMRMPITATTTAVGFLILLIVTLWYMRRRFLSDDILCWKTRTQDCQNIEDFLRSHGQLALKRYKYSQVKKMTGMFKENLGEGGYGGVFKGELPNGCVVAVKLLKESKRNGEEFINEVASISRTSHVNIVTLLGFCFEGSKRALIYEFITNGSLEKYICKQNHALEPNHRLGWDKLFDIAVGVAQGLEYLHRGCNTRILHFDIKPHNILLDENFCPKISDFGLAKICTKKESIVSMTEARGTAGYIAPEVFCRNFGGVSHKSDVYSYGMLVLDIVGGRKNIGVEVDNSSDMYFPDWIYKSLVGEEVNEVEDQIAKKLMRVSLWCIQAMPSTRPTMSRVVEMLQGSLESMPSPPRPNLSSPSNSKSVLESLAGSSSINIVTD